MSSSSQNLVKWTAGLSKGTLITLVALFMTLQALTFVGSLVSFQADRLSGTSPQGPHEDYIAFYAAGRLVADGRAHELYDAEAVGALEHQIMGRPVGGRGELAYFNPPFVALGFALPSLLPVGLFSLLMLTGLLMVVAAIGLLLTRLLGLRGWQVITLGIGILSLRSVYWLLLEGQLSAFLFLGWLGFAAFNLRGQGRRAGASLALTLIKPQMTLLLIPFLIWNRQWQALQVFGSIAAGLILVSVAIAGPEVLYAYPRFLLDSTGFEGQGVSTMSMLGLNGMIARLTNNPTPSNLWLVGIGIPIVLLIAERWSRVQTISAPTSLLLCALTLLGALLLNPHLYLQDMILIGLVVALGALYARIETGSLGYWPGLGAGMWLVQFFSPQITPLIDINPITLSILALFAITYFELRKAERASSTAARSANAAPPLPDPLAA